MEGQQSELLQKYCFVCFHLLLNSHRHHNHHHHHHHQHQQEYQNHQESVKGCSLPDCAKQICCYKFPNSTCGIRPPSIIILILGCNGECYRSLGLEGPKIPLKLT